MLLHMRAVCVGKVARVLSFQEENKKKRGRVILLMKLGEVAACVAELAMMPSLPEWVVEEGLPKLIASMVAPCVWSQCLRAAMLTASDCVGGDVCVVVG